MVSLSVTSNIAAEYGSNVVVGDDYFGTLWILNPEQNYDEHPTEGRNIKRFFIREATGQITSNSRVFQPVYQVYLEGSIGTTAKVEESANTVTLKYSDDAGNTYRDAGAIEVIEGEYNQNLAWRSLGMIRLPDDCLRLLTMALLHELMEWKFTLASKDKNQPLNDRVPVVADGTPSQYLIRLLQDKGLIVDKKISNDDLTAALAALELSQLADVDLTTAPTDVAHLR